MEEKGILPVGIEYNGNICNKYTLREQIVGDSVEVFESDDAERAMKNDAFYGVCIMARRVSVEGIPLGILTTEMLMQANQIDFDALHEASVRLDKRRLEFRNKAAGGAEDASGADETWVQQV